MAIDLIIVLLYFAGVLWIALSGRSAKTMDSEEYFLSGRRLRWYSVAVSTIATNVQGYQLLGMMGSAYLYGIAQGILEINAVQGIWMAAFIFVPLYLRSRVVTVTQFIQEKLGNTIGRFYSLANILLFSTIGLGAALFWGAYAAELAFGDYLQFLGPDKVTRVSILIIGLGVFSAIYTWFGGLSAVVRTDLMQFAILVTGGLILMFVSVNHLGGWKELYNKTPDLMHLHLPADHPKLPWTAMIGLFFLNINYWCANQTVMQRSLAARSLRDAQLGLLAGGVMKYLMALIIVVPGIALAGILMDNPLTDPDQTFPHLVVNFLPVGVRGIILCALFASLMSTVDSTFNSLATLVSVDIYKGWLRPGATDQQMVKTGQRVIIVTLFSGIIVGWLLTRVKFGAEGEAFTHTLNEIRYYVNCGIVVLICSAAFLVVKQRWAILLAFLATLPLNILFKFELFPEMNYFLRAGLVIMIAFATAWFFNESRLSTNELQTAEGQGIEKEAAAQPLIKYADRQMRNWGWVLLLSLIIIHAVFS